MDKQFSTTSEQIEILRSRGMVINNDCETARIIDMENYYNLINGYKDLFIDKSYSGNEISEKYKDGTNFNEVYALYLFDRELRSLFLRYILELENNLKSVIAHEFSNKYGHDNYMRISNFDITLKNPKDGKTTAQKYGDIADLITNLQREISNQLKKNSPMISHYILNYGYVPLWVLINTLSLGTVSHFYSKLKQQDQNNIGRKFNLMPEELRKFLFILAIFRNACAHDERLYSLKSQDKNGKNSIKDNIIHEKLNIAKNSSNNYIRGKNDLFAIVIIFKLMLNESSFNKFNLSLKSLISELAEKLYTVSIDDVTDKMGFSKNWDNIAEI